MYSRKNGKLSINTMTMNIIYVLITLHLQGIFKHIIRIINMHFTLSEYRLVYFPVKIAIVEQ